MSDDKAESARNEVKRLLSAGVIREVKYPEWLAVTPRILQLNFFFSLLAKIRALPFIFLFPLAKP
jgi:hypothetical protein